MRQKFLTKFLWAFSIFLILPVQYMKAVTNWHNDPAIVASVTDDNIDVQGLNFLVGNIGINAVAVDVAVDCTTIPSTITADDGINPGVLEIFAAAGRTVTFNLTEDLFFSGNNQSLLVTFRGQGNLVFNVAGDHAINFSAVQGSPSVFVVAMGSVVPSPLTNSVTFTRFPLGSLGAAELDLHAQVVFAGGSFMTFATYITNTEDFAAVAFDPSNNVTNTGRLILNIQDAAGFRVFGNETINDEFNNNPAPGTIGIQLTDFDFAVRAGLSAGMNILSQSPTLFSGLAITNYNTVLPQFQANPWCEINQDLTFQPGFILGQNGVLTVLSNTYIDYIGCVMNRTPNPTIPAGILKGRPLTSVVKDRNPSAFIVDGNGFEYSQIRPQINIADNAAIYFRSGVYFDPVTETEVVVPFDPNPPFQALYFGINSQYQLTGDGGYGNIVFDVEAPVDIHGDGESALQVLSWHVNPVGGSVFIESASTIFPLRDYITDANGYVQYNKGAFFINNRMNMANASLQHMDTIHKVYEQNFPLQSEATYCGGETWLLCGDRQRPTLSLVDSNVLVQTSAAFTGVDLFVPNVDELGNTSGIVFYGNGRCVDNGIGRSLILGTDIGSLASDYGTILNRDAHLNVFQEFGQTGSSTQILQLNTASNNIKVLPNDPVDQTTIANQPSVHDIYLYHATNISIGTPATQGIDPVTHLPFDLTTTPTVQIIGSFLGIDTQGGTISNPAMSMSTGEGGIFVDTNGVFEAMGTVRGYIGAIVAKSHNGIIDLPYRQIYFQNRVGVANSMLNLSDPAQLNIIGASEVLTDYTLDWANTIKDFCDENVFVPYDPLVTPAAGAAPAVVPANLQSLPVISGRVDQFQIINSMLGDEAHVMIDNGEVREFNMLVNKEQQVTAPVAFIALQNDAELGIGTANRNPDSSDAQLVLGVNGITLCANGNAQVFLNQDMLIDNVCHILKGPDFGVGSSQRLEITSVVPKELRVKTGGILDLSQFTSADDEILISGEVNLVFEPGSRLLLGQGKFHISENATVTFEPFFDAGLPAGTNINSTDNFRVKLSTNSGVEDAATEWLFSENSQMVIRAGAVVGVESAGVVTEPDITGQPARVVVDASYLTRLNIKLLDDARILVGSDIDFGGALQVGNTVDQTENEGDVQFTLTIGDSVLDSFGARLVIGSQGLLGFGVGVANKPAATFIAPNAWLVGNLFNVSRVNLNVIEGTVQHNETFLGSDLDASLLAFGNNVGGYNITFNAATGAHLLGGGNIVQVSGLLPINPVVLTTDGVINASLSAGIVTSVPMLADPSKTALPVNATATQVFTNLKQNSYQEQTTRRATFARNSLGTLTIGYVNNATIVREGIVGIIGTGGSYINPDLSLGAGAVGIALDQNDISTVYTIVT